MALLEISDEDLTFLKELAESLRTQNNRWTADPYYYTVVTTELLPALEETGNGPTQFTDVGDGDAYTANTKEEVVKMLTEYYAPDPVPEERLEHILEYGTHLVHKNNNVFLTEKACDDYIAKNSHKLRSHEKVYSYVEYADRNPELLRLIKILRSIK